jgi:alpha-beta hydrolase superfamily lysophospholipase
MLKTAALAVAGGYAGLMGLTRLGYRSLLYPAPRRGLKTAPANAELRRYPTADGAEVVLALYSAAGEALIVFFHGNGESIADSVPLAQELQRRGLRFAAVEYRGYGHSPSEDPHEDGLYADAEAALKGLVADGENEEAITLWGSSLGTGIATEMVVRGHGRRLVLQAPYTSIPDVASRIAPFLPTSLLITDRYDNLAKAEDVRLPTLVIHGDRDRVVPYDMGQTIAAAIDEAELLTVQGGGHNDLFARERERLLAAIASHARDR